MIYSFLPVGTILDASIAETLGSSVSTQTSLQDEALVREIDRINRRFLNAPKTEATNESWSWMNDSEKVFETYDATALSAAISSGALTFAVSSVTGFPTSGRVWMDTSKDVIDIVDYSSISTLTLTVDTDGEQVDIDHDTDHVELLYALPTDFNRVLELFVDGTKFDPIDSDQLPLGRYYMLKGNYMLFPKDVGTRDVRLEYQKGATDLDTGDTTVDKARDTQIPVDFLDYPFHMLNAYIQRQRRKFDSMNTELALAAEALQNALSADINETDDFIYA